MKAAAAVTHLDSGRDIVVVGLGLIGRSIAARLASLEPQHILRQPYGDEFWSNSDLLCALLAESLPGTADSELELIWCAGKAGFSASTPETAAELAFFGAALRTLRAEYGNRLKVSFISSAGALYDERSDSLTPYGELKKSQEQLLHELDIQCRIFRVGTVYDAPADGIRLGLVAKLISDAQLGLPTTLFANAHTRRDFLLVDDVALYITTSVISNEGSVQRLLVSGRAVSLQTLVLMLEKVIKRKVKVNFMTTTHNDNDLLFSRSDLPENFKVTSLEEGLRLVFSRSLSSQQRCQRAQTNGA